MNVISACKVLTDSSKFRVTVDANGAFEVMAVPRPGFEGAIFKTGWSRGVLMFNHSEICSLNSMLHAGVSWRVPAPVQDILSPSPNKMVFVVGADPALKGCFPTCSGNFGFPICFP